MKASTPSAYYGRLTYMSSTSMAKRRGGDVTQATLPDEILFDYVRVYQAP